MHQATAIGAGRGEYYIALGRDDYYTQGGEPPGVWYGRATEKAGVSGQVEAQHFRNLLGGVSVDGKEVLVQKQHYVKTTEDGQPKREPCAGYDLHFSVPKSVSLIWAFGAEATRRAIESCHDRAVKLALDVLQEEAGFSRRGKGGEERVRAELLVALFQHGASRALDPQLHTHAVALNIAWCEDGERRAVNGHLFYRWQKAIGSIYDAELARLLHEDLGLKAYKKGQSFEIDGVSESACEAMSKRRAAILEVASASSHPAVREIAALSTRDKKANVSHEDRLKLWHEVGPEIGFTEKNVEVLVNAPRVPRDLEADRNEAFHAAIEKLSQNESHFTAREFYNALSQAAHDKALGPMMDDARDFLAASSDVIRLGELEGEFRYATKNVWEVERNLIAAVESTKETTTHVVRGETLLKGVRQFEAEKGFRLKPEQLKAISDITLDPGSVKAVTGHAGTGKTTMLGAAKAVWKEAGLEVIGCALAGKAATNLREETSMDAQSVRRTLFYIEKGRITITSRTVMVVDEAAMVDTFQAARLVEAVTSRGGKIVLVGDALQLQAIGPGGAFQGIVNRVGDSKLKINSRQTNEEDRAAITLLMKSQGAEALKSYAERGLVHVSAQTSQAIRKLIRDWEEKGGARDAKDHLIITGRKDATERLNKEAQEKARTAGVLGQENMTVNGRLFFERDRILFTYTSEKAGVDNGTLGTIERLDRSSCRMTVLLDDGKRVSIDTRRYNHIDLGYAITTHRGQGITVNCNAYVLAGGRMQDLHLTYVQASRAKEDTRFYTTRAEAGDKLTRLSAQMSRDREKSLAHDVIERPRLKEERRLGL